MEEQDSACQAVSRTRQNVNHSQHSPDSTWFNIVEYSIRFMTNFPTIFIFAGKYPDLSQFGPGQTIQSDMTRGRPVTKGRVTIVTQDRKALSRRHNVSLGWRLSDQTGKGSKESTWLRISFM